MAVGETPGAPQRSVKRTAAVAGDVPGMRATTVTSYR